MAKREIPLAAMEKILREVGAQRISEKSKESLQKVLEEKCREVGMLAMRFAMHANRKTIKEDDIQLALQQLK
jgi:DNA-binding protein